MAALADDARVPFGTPSIDLVNLRFEDVIGDRIVSPIRKTDTQAREIEATSVDFPSRRAASDSGCPPLEPQARALPLHRSSPARTAYGTGEQRTRLAPDRTSGSGAPGLRIESVPQSAASGSRSDPSFRRFRPSGDADLARDLRAVIPSVRKSRVPTVGRSGADGAHGPRYDEGLSERPCTQSASRRHDAPVQCAGARRRRQGTPVRLSRGLPPGSSRTVDAAWSLKRQGAGNDEQSIQRK